MCYSSSLPCATEPLLHAPSLRYVCPGGNYACIVLLALLTLSTWDGPGLGARLSFRNETFFFLVFAAEDGLRSSRDSVHRRRLALNRRRLANLPSAARRTCTTLPLPAPPADPH